MKTTKGIYIHIPFCLSKCTYCDFYSVAKDTETMEMYVKALVKEIELSSIKFKDDVIDTLYIGGGTPSALPLYLLEKIINAIYSNYNLQLKEFTIEANPATDIDFYALKNMGINRISLGVQTLNDKLLKIIGRRHDKKTALDTLERASEYFDNLSCDIMIGLPTQTLSDVEEAVVSLKDKVKHISMYMLKLSESVPMFKQIESGLYSLPDDDLTVDFYDRAYSLMKEAGFHRYEISNFSQNGYESLHNLKYWNREEYIGLGAAAHGFVDGYRYFNPSDINRYILGYNYGADKVEKEFIDIETALFEKIMLAFRLPSGIDLNEINSEFEIDFVSKYRSQLERLKSVLEINDNRLFIKEQFMLLESAVAREFLI